MSETECDDIPPGDVFTMTFSATLTAVVRAEESGGFSAEIPGLPGCVTEAETLDELRVNLREATEGWLEAMGRPEMPLPVNRAAVIVVGKGESE